MLVEITDQAGTSGTVIVHVQDVADTIRPWYPEAPAEVVQAIDDLQTAIDRDDHTQHGLAEFLSIGLFAVDTVEVAFGARAQADYLISSLRACDASAGSHIADDGRTVFLTSQALGVLAEFNEHADGHFDGQHVWIGGTEYAVTATSGPVRAVFV